MATGEQLTQSPASGTPTVTPAVVYKYSEEQFAEIRAKAILDYEVEKDLRRKVRAVVYVQRFVRRSRKRKNTKAKVKPVMSQGYMSKGREAPTWSPGRKQSATVQALPPSPLSPSPTPEAESKSPSQHQLPEFGGRPTNRPVLSESPNKKPPVAMQATRQYLPPEKPRPSKASHKYKVAEEWESSSRKDGAGLGGSRQTQVKAEACQQT